MLGNGGGQLKSAGVICGQIGSGKSTVAAILASRLSCQVVSFGKYVREIANRDGRSATRSVLQDLGETLYQRIGAPGLLEGALEIAGVKNDDTVVFDGVRHIEVLSEIRRRSGKTVAIYLAVDPEQRYRRRQSQGTGGLSREEFDAIDRHPVEVEIGDLAQLCDYVIDASQPLTQLESDLPAELFALKAP